MTLRYVEFLLNNKILKVHPDVIGTKFGIGIEDVIKVVELMDALLLNKVLEDAVKKYCHRGASCFLEWLELLNKKCCSYVSRAALEATELEEPELEATELEEPIKLEEQNIIEKLYYMDNIVECIGKLDLKRQQISSLSQFNDVRRDEFFSSEEEKVNREINKLSGEFYKLKKKILEDVALIVNYLYLVVESSRAIAKPYFDEIIFSLGIEPGVFDVMANIQLKYLCYHQEVESITKELACLSDKDFENCYNGKIEKSILDDDDGEALTLRDVIEFNKVVGMAPGGVLIQNQQQLMSDIVGRCKAAGIPTYNIESNLQNLMNQCMEFTNNITEQIILLYNELKIHVKRKVTLKRNFKSEKAGNGDSKAVRFLLAVEHVNRTICECKKKYDSAIEKMKSDKIAIAISLNNINLKLDKIKTGIQKSENKNKFGLLNIINLIFFNKEKFVEFKAKVVVFLEGLQSTVVTETIEFSHNKYGSLKNELGFVQMFDHVTNISNEMEKIDYRQLNQYCENCNAMGIELSEPDKGLYGTKILMIINNIKDSLKKFEKIVINISKEGSKLESLLNERESLRKEVEQQIQERSNNESQLVLDICNYDIVMQSNDCDESIESKKIRIYTILYNEIYRSHKRYDALMAECRPISVYNTLIGYLKEFKELVNTAKSKEGLVESAMIRLAVLGDEFSHVNDLLPYLDKSLTLSSIIELSGQSDATKQLVEKRLPIARNAGDTIPPIVK